MQLRGLCWAENNLLTELQLNISDIIEIADCSSAPGLDCRDFIILPGFVNMALEYSSDALLESIKDGCTTTALLFDSPKEQILEHRAVNFLPKSASQWSKGDITISKLNDFQYELRSISSSVSNTISSVPFNSLPSFYGSGNQKQQVSSIWTKLNFDCMNLLLESDANIIHVFDIYHNATSKACESLGVHQTGKISNGYKSDLIIIKKCSKFDYSNSPELFLKSLLLKGSREDVHAVIKEGNIIHSSQEFKDMIQCASLSKYYSSPNLPKSLISSSDSKNLFDTIEKAIEDISIIFNNF